MLEEKILLDKLDLHIHSTYSDGLLNVEEIFRIAKKAKFKGIAITDHDTAEHWEEVMKIGELRKIPYILGTEFSTMHMGREVHILGYNYNPNSTNVSNILKEYKEANIKWVINLVINFAAKTGKTVDFSKFDYKGTPDKVRVTKFLIENGHLFLKDNQPLSKLVEQTFKQGGKFHVQRKIKRRNSAETINAIHEAGGIAVLAHPSRSKLTPEDVKFFCEKVGVDGIEIYNKRNNVDAEMFLPLAEKYNLLITGGSDFHNNGLLGAPLPEETYNKFFNTEL